MRSIPCEICGTWMDEYEWEHGGRICEKCENKQSTPNASLQTQPAARDVVDTGAEWRAREDREDAALLRKIAARQPSPKPRSKNHDQHPRVDLSEICEPWLHDLKPTITPLYAHPPQPDARTSYQTGVNAYVVDCFGQEIADDKTERTHRFLEESHELAQAAGCTASEAHQIVDWVHSKSQGEVRGEIGDVMNTLAALATAHDIDMMTAATDKMVECWEKIEKTRAKHANKPKFVHAGGGECP